MSFVSSFNSTSSPEFISRGSFFSTLVSKLPSINEKNIQYAVDRITTFAINRKINNAIFAVATRHIPSFHPSTHVAMGSYRYSWMWLRNT